MAGYIGRIEAFDESLETWESYVERLDQYFIVNKVENDMKVPALLSLIGGKTYTLLRNLASPARPADKTFVQIVKLLKDHLSPEPLQIAERHRFHQRVQREGENINNYIASLRKLSEHCDFQDLNNTLRDQLVCGLRNQQIKKRLLSEAKLTLPKALEISIAMETAAKDAAELNTREAVGLNKLKRGPSSRQHEFKSTTKCYRCNGLNHRAADCRFKDAACFKCKKRGHIQKACRSADRRRPWQETKKKVHTLKEETHDVEQDLSNLGIYSVRNDKCKPIWVEPMINGKTVKMELDTGSALSVISEHDFKDKYGDAPLEKTEVTLKTYSGEKLVPLGYAKVHVKYQDQKADLKLYVLNSGCHPLFGREWLQYIQLDWRSLKLHKLEDSKPQNSTLQQILKAYKSVFEEGIGKVKGIKAKFTFKPDTTPKFIKARPVPYALKPKIEQELRKLQEQGIITPVAYSDWATPIVPVIKKDGKSVRICGDFKVTVNPQLAVDQYPLPRIEDIFASLSGGKRFTKIDLRNAYLQLEVDNDHQKYLTINTSLGLFQYKRLCFGVASAPAIWQRTIDQILGGLNGVQCILDDMIVTGDSNEQHLANLENVLKRLSEYNLKVNLDKCEFFKERVQYCGHEIDSEGLHKMADKVESVLNTPAPQNVSQLRAFLGLINYYHRFLCNVSTVVKPMSRLLEKDKKWNWDSECEAAFKECKKLVTSDIVLCHHNPKRPIRLACDASPFGVGAVISHIMDDGTERPIAFASRTLTKTEQARSQIDKEATAIIFGVKKFHTYLFGRHFTLITDHQPLVSIFSPKRGISLTTAARLQRYALYLTGYDYDIEYRNTKLHSNADALSRLPYENTEDKPDPVDLFYTEQLEQAPINSASVKRETQREKILSRVYEYILKGWTKPEEQCLQAYYTRRDELTVHPGCILWGIRVVIPIKLRKEVLEMLHLGHPGVVKMKAIARSYVWWPGIDSDIEHLAKQCSGCQLYAKNPQTAPLHPWEWPSTPYERIHIDFAGPFMNSMFLVIVDAHSKWPEVFTMRSTTTGLTIDILRSVFARNGIPKQIVTDNGPQFISDEFRAFIVSNGIKHYRSAPYHPATNGLAERFIQTMKQSLRAMSTLPKSMNVKLANFLMTYRNTPHSTTNETPAKLFLGRNIRTRLDLLKPDIKGHVQNKQFDKSFISSKNKLRQFDTGQTVNVRNYRGEDKWKTASVTNRTGPLMYEVQTPEGVIWRRHVDQIRDTEMRKDIISEQQINIDQSDANENAVTEILPNITDNSEHSSVNNSEQNYRRYPVRNRQPSKRLINEM